MGLTQFRHVEVLTNNGQSHAMSLVLIIFYWFMSLSIMHCFSGPI